MDADKTGVPFMLNRMVYIILATFVLMTAATLVLIPTMTQAQEGSVSDTFSGEELVDTGGEFFGGVAQGLASLVERAVSQFGLPNAYILGEEGSGAIFAGARYGEGTMYTRNQGEHPVYWQGPSIGFDFGGDGSKVMMLVYNLASVSDVFGRYPGVDGSAYGIGGRGLPGLTHGPVVMVPRPTGAGARLGINVGYLKFTQEPTWNPF